MSLTVEGCILINNVQQPGRSAGAEGPGQEDPEMKKRGFLERRPPGTPETKMGLPGAKGSTGRPNM